MESKIEKIGDFLVPSSTSEGVTDALQSLADKLNEIIDYLNSQAQPEENEPEKVYVDPIVPNFTGELSAPVEYKTREQVKEMFNDTPEEKKFPIENNGGTIFPVVGEIKPMSKEEWVEFQKEIKDTPEEWEEDFEGMWFKEEDGNGCVKAEPIKNFIKQLLKEREREVLERLIGKRTRLPFTENWLVWLTHITRELDKLDGRKQ